MPDGRVLVTGANRGIGRHLAEGLAAAGYDVGLLGRRREPLEEAAAACREAGAPRAIAVVADVVDRDQVRAAVAEVDEALGGIDLLINNAGAIEQMEGSFLETDVEDTWRVIEVNLRGPVVAAHAVLPGMLDRGTGRIVNINSGMAYKPMPVYTGYAVSKGALARLTAVLDAQLRDRGVFAFDVAPGVVQTDMTAGMPMQSERTEWTSPDAVVELVLGIAAGELDQLSGRLFRAGADTVDSLLVSAEEIIDREARVLRLAPIDPNDPVA